MTTERHITFVNRPLFKTRRSIIFSNGPLFFETRDSAPISVLFINRLFFFFGPSRQKVKYSILGEEVIVPSKVSASASMYGPHSNN